MKHLFGTATRANKVHDYLNLTNGRHYSSLVFFSVALCLVRASLQRARPPASSGWRRRSVHVRATIRLTTLHLCRTSCLVARCKLWPQSLTQRHLFTDHPKRLLWITVRWIKHQRNTSISISCFHILKSLCVISEFGSLKKAYLRMP